MFGKGLVDQLRRKVQSEFEGRVLEGVGFCMCITGWTSTSKGKLCDGGSASFVVSFQALFCCPYVDQVIDATVTSVDHIGAQCVAGPVSIFISHHVCRCSILAISSQNPALTFLLFSTPQAMPQFSHSPELGCWTNNENPSETITAHTKLRLRITSVSLFQKSVVRFRSLFHFCSPIFQLK